MSNIEDLRWMRIFTPDHIPKYLIEQVRDRDYSVEDFYDYHRFNCLTEEEKLNPFSHLYVLADKTNQVKGMLWFDVDPLTKDILIQTYSVDKEYWNKGVAVKKLAEHVKDIRKKGNLKKIFWVTNYPKHSEKNGFKRSKNILMEYNGEKEDNAYGKNIQQRKNEAHRERESSDTAAELISVECIGTAAA